jgi:hypothetical protein
LAGLTLTTTLQTLRSWWHFGNPGILPPFLGDSAKSRNRETTEESYRHFEVPAQTNQDSFRYRRVAIFTKPNALRINTNTDGM